MAGSVCRFSSARCVSSSPLLLVAVVAAIWAVVSSSSHVSSAMSAQTPLAEAWAAF